MKIRSAEIEGAYLILGPNIDGQQNGDEAVVRALCSHADARLLVRECREAIANLFREAIYAMRDREELWN